ncbi:MAG: PQQ-binding-like beta-propeller repeat protein [Polyangiales bacterium]
MLGRVLDLWLRLGLLAALPAVSACAKLAQQRDHALIDHAALPRLAKTSALSLHWSFDTQPERGRSGHFVPVEHATAVASAAMNRVFCGSSAGELVALRGDGAVAFRYRTGDGVESKPALDEAADALFVGGEDGQLHALRASDGKLHWRRRIRGSIRGQPVLSRDAVFVVSSDDVLAAFARRDGKVLWMLQHDRNEGLSSAGHAGLVRHGDLLLTAMTNGDVLAIHAQEGAVVWDFATADDIAAEADDDVLFDVDTTPVVVNERVYVASSHGGLYVLAAESGELIDRDPRLRAVSALTTDGRTLYLTAHGRGIVAYAPEAQRIVWQRPVSGALAPPVVADGKLIAGESQGRLLVLDAATGKLLAAMRDSQGFAAPVEVAGERWFVLTNGGTLWALSWGARRPPETPPDWRFAPWSLWQR